MEFFFFIIISFIFTFVSINFFKLIYNLVCKKEEKKLDIIFPIISILFIFIYLWTIKVDVLRYYRASYFDRYLSLDVLLASQKVIVFLGLIILITTSTAYFIYNTFFKNRISYYISCLILYLLLFFVVIKLGVISFDIDELSKSFFNLLPPIGMRIKYGFIIGILLAYRIDYIIEKHKKDDFASLYILKSVVIIVLFIIILAFQFKIIIDIYPSYLYEKELSIQFKILIPFDSTSTFFKNNNEDGSEKLKLKNLKFDEIKIGKTVSFGRKTSGDIEWIVLDKNKDKKEVLLLSKNGLDVQQNDTLERRLKDYKSYSSYYNSDYEYDDSSEEEFNYYNSALRYEMYRCYNNFVEYNLSKDKIKEFNEYDYKDNIVDTYLSDTNTFEKFFPLSQAEYNKYKKMEAVGNFYFENDKSYIIYKNQFRNVFYVLRTFRTNEYGYDFLCVDTPYDFLTYDMHEDLSKKNNLIGNTFWFNDRFIYDYKNPNYNQRVADDLYHGYVDCVIRPAMWYRCSDEVDDTNADDTDADYTNADKDEFVSNNQYVNNIKDLFYVKNDTSYVIFDDKEYKICEVEENTKELYNNDSIYYIEIDDIYYAIFRNTKDKKDKVYSIKNDKDGVKINLLIEISKEKNEKLEFLYRNNDNFYFSKIETKMNNNKAESIGSIIELQDGKVNYIYKDIKINNKVDDMLFYCLNIDTVFYISRNYSGTTYTINSIKNEESKIIYDDASLLVANSKRVMATVDGIYYNMLKKDGIAFYDGEEHMLTKDVYIREIKKTSSNNMFYIITNTHKKINLNNYIDSNSYPNSILKEIDNIDINNALYITQDLYAVSGKDCKIIGQNLNLTLNVSVQDEYILFYTLKRIFNRKVRYVEFKDFISNKKYAAEKPFIEQIKNNFGDFLYKNNEFVYIYRGFDGTRLKFDDKELLACKNYLIDNDKIYYVVLQIGDFYVGDLKLNQISKLKKVSNNNNYNKIFNASDNIFIDKKYENDIHDWYKYADEKFKTISINEDNSINVYEDSNSNIYLYNEKGIYLYDLNNNILNLIIENTDKEKINMLYKIKRN